MKSAALIFGFLAGLFGGAVIAFGNLEPGLAAVLSHGTRGDLVAKFVLFAIPGLGLLGAGLAISVPRLGAFFMLLSAVAWGAVALLAGHGAVLFAALPFTFAGAGGLVALFAPRPAEVVEEEPQEPLPPHRRLTHRHWQEAGADSAETADEGPAIPPRRREVTERSEPDFAAAAPRRHLRGPQPVAPRYLDPEPEADDEPLAYEQEPEEEAEEEDYIDADPAVDEEPEDEQEEDRPDEVEEPRIAPPSRGPAPRRERWSLPDPGDQPVRRQPPRPRYVAERQAPPPTRRQFVPVRDEPRAARHAADEDDFELAPDDYAPRRRNQQMLAREPYRDFDEEEDEQPRPNPLRTMLKILVLLLFFLLVAGIAAAIYLDYQRGSQSLLFGNRVHRATTAPVHPAPSHAGSSNGAMSDTAPAASGTGGRQRAVEPKAASVATASPAPMEAPPVAPSAPVSTAAGDTMPVAPLAQAPAATGDAAVAAAGMSDPFAYCQSVDTIDTPDSRYTGPAVPGVIASALSLTGNAPGDQVHWRCAGGQVLACNANHTAACGLTPTVDLMVSYCTQHPDTKNMPAPNGSWSCNGKRPSIPSDQQWPVDARGFYPGAWSRVSAGPTSG